MKTLILIALLASSIGSATVASERTQKAKSPVFSFAPDSLGQNYNDDTTVIKMRTSARVIDSIRLRPFVWSNGHYQELSPDMASSVGVRIEDAIYDFNSFVAYTSNIKLKRKAVHKVRILGIDACPGCWGQNTRYDMRIRFFAKGDSGEIKVNMIH
ncbi:MAG: hypothetical protein JWO30_4252 [Fibrobacteres bacterium]|nr:hypothetical protein [Fibrobacterota bacterium]